MPRPVITPDMLDRAKKLVAACEDTATFLNDCKACKIDVAQEIADNDEQRQIAEAILARFSDYVK